MSLFSDMKAPADIDDRIWRALSDGTRRDMLDTLAARPRTTGEMVATFAPLCRTAVMKHLDVLEGAGLLVVRREGRRRWNHFNPVPIDHVCGRWLDARRRRMSGALRRLRSLIGSDEDDSNP